MTRARRPPAPAARLLRWQARHGRHDLPWQQDPTPYRVWVSEIMLQQTQVGTATPYYQRFLERFPDVRALAAAPQDEVLHLWSGLGYYARARNLHEAARRVVNDHGGELPDSLDALTGLPGIGRSTAGAILALGFGRRAPICDGNVKRVLSRYFGLREAPGAAADRALWALAEACTPRRRVAAYTQAIMDLGATVCTRTQPDCPRCPLRGDCVALAQGRVDELPLRRARSGARRLERRVMVFALAGDAVLLRRRAPGGVWGGLWTPPEFGAEAAALDWCVAELGVPAREVGRLPLLRHVFTHFDLDILPLVARVARRPARVEQPGSLWYNSRAPQPVGLPAPVAALIGACTGGAEERDGEDGAVRAAGSRGRGPRSRALSR